MLVPETRPYLQGARLTAWELHQDGIPLTLITDNMVGHFLRTGNVGAVVVGADRIAANGDTADRIRHLRASPSWLAENNVPFYVAAPISTLDLSPRLRRIHIPIEERSSPTKSPTSPASHVAPDNVKAAHPASGGSRAQTNKLTAIITERGVATAP